MIEADIFAGLAAAAALALVVTGLWLLRQPGGNRTKAVLMVLAGLVVAGNAWISSLPVPATPDSSTSFILPETSDIPQKPATAPIPPRAEPSAN